MNMCVTVGVMKKKKKSNNYLFAKRNEMKNKE